MKKVVIVICCILLCTMCFCAPVVSAAQVATKELYVGFGGIRTQIFSGKATVITMLVGGLGSLFFSFADVDEPAETIYNNSPENVQQWYDEVGETVVNGGVVRLPVEVVTSFNTLASPYRVSIPADATYLGGVTQALYLEQYANGGVYHNALSLALVEQIGLLQALSLSVDNLSTTFEVKIEKLRTGFLTEIVNTRVAIVNALNTKIDGLYNQLDRLITYNTQQLVDTRVALHNMVEAGIHGLYENISLVRSQVVEQLVISRTNTLEKLREIENNFDDLVQRIDDLDKNFTDAIGDLREELKSLAGTTVDLATPPNYYNPSGNIEDVDSALNTGVAYIPVNLSGEGSAALRQYYDGLTAVRWLFGNLTINTVFEDLLSISLALAVFAFLCNIAQSVKSSAGAATKNASKSNKGG